MILTGMFRLILWLALSVVAAGAVPENASYTLRPNDTIRLAVYEEPDLSVQVRILKTGQVSFPLIGSVEVGGLSVADATRNIRDRYARDFLVDPKITLTVDEYATEFISVIGAVKIPGQIPMPVSGHLDLASAMATVGGLAPEADATGIQLVRAAGTTTSFSMDSIQGASGRVQLAAGDRIIVNQSAFVGKTVTVLGQVGKPGPLPFPLNGHLDLVNAIALAGGVTELANPKKVSINRKGVVTMVNFKEISQRGDRPWLLHPDDVFRGENGLPARRREVGADDDQPVGRSARRVRGRHEEGFEPLATGERQVGSVRKSPRQRDGGQHRVAGRLDEQHRPRRGGSDRGVAASAVDRPQTRATRVTGHEGRGDGTGRDTARRARAAECVTIASTVAITRVPAMGSIA